MAMGLFWLCTALFLSALGGKADTKPPNILFILTDDQDVYMDSMESMNKTRMLLGEAGVTFSNMFVTSPLCCPSRSSILSGRYTHNHQALNNSVSGNCSSAAWQQHSETDAFPVHLQQAGYKTFFAGKYLNQYGKKQSGGVAHVPPGWNDWNGLVGNSVYYNYSLSVNGKEEKHGNKYPDDYLTEVIGKKASDFLESNDFSQKPFFMMLSTPACHAPFTPAPQYNKSFSDRHAPRTPSYGVHTTDKHWLANRATPMTNDTKASIDEIFRNRWRTLLTVDDIVADLVGRLQKKKLLADTYIFFTGDNGYHLGQFNLPNDKRQLYEFDIRVPLLVRGPGIAANHTQDAIALNIDFAPTFLDIAGVTPSTDIDGSSLKSLLTTGKPPPGWRTDFMVEHFGESAESVPGCPQYTAQSMYNCEFQCTCEDAANNTYGCVRQVSSTGNLMYCQFSDTEDCVEVYDLAKDPHQLTNVRKTIDPKVLVSMSTRLVQLAICSGDSCRKNSHHFDGYHSIKPSGMWENYGLDNKPGNELENYIVHTIEEMESGPVADEPLEAAQKLEKPVTMETDEVRDDNKWKATVRSLLWCWSQSVKWFTNMGYLA